MRAPEPVTLQRGVVALAPWRPEHEPDLLRAAAHEDVWQWLPVPQVVDLQGLHRFRDRPRDVLFAVLYDGVAVGSTSYLDVDLSVGGLEIGATWYRRDLWGTQINPTCKLLLLGHAFDDLGVHRVTLKTDALNARSRAAIAKLGCRYDGTLRHWQLRSDGTVRDTAYYSLLTAEWPAARERLEARLLS